MLGVRLTPSLILLLVLFVESGFIIGAVAMVLGSRRNTGTIKRERRLKFISYFFIVHAVLAAAIVGRPWFSLLLAVILCFGAFELITVTFSTKKKLKTYLPFHTAVILYLLCGIAGIRFSFSAGSGRLLYCYLVVAVLDAYSQLSGQLFGKHKLAPAISPNKSFEGAFGGVSAATVTAMVFHSMAGFSLLQSIGAGVLISLTGITGDLAASWYKRYVDLKDYSRLLPGQGGFLDRFNSLIAVLPVFNIYCSVVLSFSRC